MRTTLLLVTLALLGAAASEFTPPAWADDGAPPPPPPPPPIDGGSPTPRPPAAAPQPTARQYIPVPDVRGLTESQATRALAQVGLRLGGIERVSVAAMEAELGRRYAPGIVVQQAPRPSAGDQPSWLAVGASVWLRVTTAGAGTPPTPIPPVPGTPSQPRVPVVPVPPVTTYPAPSDSPPPPPPPPYAVDGTAPPPSPTVYPPTQRLPTDPYAGDLATLRRLPARLRLPCERGRGLWHLRGLGGGAFSLGTDNGDFGAYAGLDIGHTFDECIGVDLFYRYTSTRFSRLATGGTMKDGGDIHIIGLKATYEGSFDRTSPMYYWAGIGPTWFTTKRLAANDSGLGGFVAVGIGYLIARDVRIRLGLDIHALRTSAGRFNPARDREDRWLWSLAPSLGIQFDL